jgi:murein DD-endopeptidase MepM/ murein hydrolase activator NlpD
MVGAGDQVKAGDLVAITDNTGSNTSGAHLHFGIAVYAGTGSYSDNSQTRNPLNYLPQDRNTIGCSR